MLEIGSKEYNKQFKYYTRKLNMYPERWSFISIKGLETDYMVSNHGRILNRKTGKTIEPKYGTDNYQSVKIHLANGETVRTVAHRLVARYFCEIPERLLKEGYSYDGLVVNHKNGIKRCNAAFNLEWCTQYENMEHAFNTGLCTDIFGEKSHLAKISRGQVHDICRLIMKKLPTSEIAEITGAPIRTIAHIRCGETWKRQTAKYDFPKSSAKVLHGDEKIHEVCKLLELHKYSDSDISKKTGVSRRYITEIRNGEKRQNISSLYNIDPRPVDPMGESKIRRICELLEEGKLSQYKIANEVDVSQATVSHIYNRKKHTDISHEYTF